MSRLLLLTVFVAVSLELFAQQTFTNFASKNTITTLADDGTKMWIGTSGGLYVRNKSTGAITLTYTIDNGLSNNYITDLVVDPFSNVWVATMEGLAKFNGSTWTIYDEDQNLPMNFLKGITVDQSGNVWVVSYSALSKLEANGTFTNFPFNNYNPEALQCGPDGDLWIGTYGGGAFRFNISTESFTQYTEFGTYQRVYDIIVDASSNLWFTGYDQLTKFDGGTWTSYNASNGLADNGGVSLTSDIDGNIWVAHFASGITKFDPNGVNTQIYSTSNGLGHNYTSAITVDTDGRVWVGTRYGLNRLNTSTSVWNEFIVSNSISNNEIYDIAVDGSGVIWVGTEYGLSKLNGSTWTSYFQSDGLVQDRVKTIAFDGLGNVWTGTNYGITKFNGTTFTAYNNANTSQTVDIACTPDNKVWMAKGSSGFTVFDGTTYTSYTTANGLISNNISSVAVDQAGNVWAGSSSGVSVWNGTSFTNYNSSSGLPSNFVNEISIAADGSVWVATNNGFGVYNGSYWDQINNADGLLETVCYEMVQDANGGNWFASYSGVMKNANNAVVKYTTADGLPDNYITDAAISGNTKWFGTQSGLVKVECEAPIASFSHSGYCLPGQTEFNNSSTQSDATSMYQWDIQNDGSTDYYGASCNHEYSTQGVYQVKLTVSNDNCSSNTTQSVNIYNTPNVTMFPGTEVDICSGSSTSLYPINNPSLTSLFSESFNSTDLTALGWTIQGLGTTNWQSVNSNFSGGVANELRLIYNPSFNGISQIVSPIIDASTAESLELSFKHSINHYSNSYVVGIKTSSDGVTWNSVWSQNISADVPAEIQTITINNADSQSNTLQIAFVFEGNSFDIDYWYIDDIQLNGTVSSPLDPTYTYLWSTSATTPQLSVSTPGEYYVVVNNHGCNFEAPHVQVDIAEPTSVSICMVTVDTTDGKNLIVWERPITGSIDHFNVYKEISTDNYQLIGSKNYNDMSEFTDISSEPNVHADKYKISSVDTCGNESDLSPFHQTMNLSQAQGAQSNEIVLLWNKYIDESGSYIPAQYHIYRGLDIENMTNENSLSGGLSSYNYNASSVVDGEHFIVQVDMPECAPSGGSRASGGPYYQSSSNIEDEGIINTGISTVKAGEISVYPNPFKDNCVVSSNSPIISIKLYNVIGELVFDENNIMSYSYQLNRQKIKQGTYFLKINNQKEVKLIVE